MNNAELIKALRVEPFEVGSFGLARIMNQAADLIEARQVDLRKANEIIEEGIRVSRKSRAALETAQKLIAELEADKKTLINVVKDKSDFHATKDAMRIAELEAQLPKKGGWISNYDGFDYDVRCSVCGEEALIKEGGSHDHAYSRYCPNCGARMKGEQE